MCGVLRRNCKIDARRHGYDLLPSLVRQHKHCVNSARTLCKLMLEGLNRFMDINVRPATRAGWGVAVCFNQHTKPWTSRPLR